jgi:hypothetical protein
LNRAVILLVGKIGVSKKESRDGRFCIRLNREDAAKLEHMSMETGKSKSDILRKGLEMQYKIFVATH